MRVISFGAAAARAGAAQGEEIDLTRCTRCGEAWGYEIVEQVQVWSCFHCGYEARERSADHSAMLDARQESMIT